MIINDLIKAGVIKPGSNCPKWLPHNCHYLTVMGSEAYGVAIDDSDKDIYGFCMPPVNMMFPHLEGHIPGFGPEPQKFEQWQQHHLAHHSGGFLRNYDFSIYSIVKFFSLCAENNPNMIDALFTPRTCIIHSTEIGNSVREHRKAFLHKGAVPKFRGYAYSQMHKIRIKVNPENEKRKANVEKHGYDLKFAYHVVRLVNECEQIMLTHDLDLQRDNEILKSIRRGEWTIEKLEEWFAEAEKRLDRLSDRSTLPDKPDMVFLRQVLMDSIESHYGTISKAISLTGKEGSLLKDLKTLLERYT